LESDVVTVVTALVGIGVGLLSSWWFAKSSVNRAKADQVQLRDQIALLRDLFADVRVNLEADETQLSREEAFDDLRESRADITDETVTLAESRVDTLIRTSLGTLLNERGQVRVSALIQEICRRPGAPEPAMIVSSLGRLRAGGTIAFDSNEISAATLLQVLPHISE
jgi:hypothetical protein